MMNKNFLRIAPLSFVIAVAACAVDTAPEEEALGESYELLEGDTDRARCVDRPMRREADERVACRAVEVRRPDADGRCDCDVAGRRELTQTERERVMRDLERDDRTRDRDLSCACELRQLDRDDLRRCQQDERDDVRRDDGDRIDGWCAEVRDGINAELDRCDRHGIRLVGDARVRPDAEVLLRCD